jgi:hypothetical protein
MYLTNVERLQLDLVGYGSDVPEEVVEAARASKGCDVMVQDGVAKPAKRRTAKAEG